VSTLLDNRYQPLRTLGEGAMGEVLLVEDTLTKQHLALKVIAQKAGVNDKSVLQFQQEFRLMTRLRHPNCCAVTSYGLLADGAPYFTMEVVPGHGLDELLPLDEPTFRTVFAQLLLALGYVHQQGFVHRDLKPANVRVKPDGTVKLMDFGLMEHAGRVGGPIVGTLPYLSPEIAKRGAVDGRSDLYSVGALAYELLTGQPPFPRATPMEVLRAHVGEAPPPMNRVRAGISAPLEAVVTKLLAKEPVDRFQSAYEVLEALGHEVPAGIGGTLLSAALVGRERELDILASGLASVVEGTPPAPLLLWGPEGTGKTRLLEELRFQAELAAVPFVMGKAYESGNFPYRHFVWILKSLVPAMRQHVPDDLARLAPVLVKLLPELGVPAAPEMEAGQEKLRLQTAVTDAMLTLARAQGYVVAFENWQWAEPLSIELLAHLLRNVGDAPIQLVVSSRLAHGGEAGGLSALTRKRLQPLSRADLARMVASMLGGDDVAAHLLDQIEALTEGNPLFVERLLEHLVKAGRLAKARGHWVTEVTLTSADLPSGLQGLLAENLSALSPGAVAVARAGAVLGQVFDLAVLRHTADLPDGPLFDALDELAIQQVLTAGERGTYGFTRASFQPIFYAQVEPEARLAMHRRAVAALEEALGDTPLTRAPLELVTGLARHAVIAGETDKAVAYSLQAGLRSARLFANADAEEFFNAGLRQLQGVGDERSRAQRQQFLHALGDVRRVAANWEGARSALEEAARLAKAAGDDTALGAILGSLAKSLQLLRQLPAALEAAQQSLEASLRVGTLGEGARALQTMARISYYQGKADQAMAECERALDLARDGGDSIQQAGALGFLGYLYASTGRGEAGISALRESIALNEALGDRVGLHTALDYLANTEMLRGEFQSAQATLERKNALCVAIGYESERAYGLVNMAVVELEMGTAGEAARLARASAELPGTQTDAIVLSFARLIEGVAEARSGHMLRAFKLVAECEKHAEPLNNQYLHTELLPYRVGLAVFLGDAAEARRHLARLTAFGDPGTIGRVLEGEVCLLENRPEEARTALLEACELARAGETQGLLLRAQTGLARAHVRLAAWDEAEAVITEGLALAGRLGVLGLAAELSGLRGEVALASGRTADAKAHFRDMADLAEVCGQVPLKAEALFGQAAAAPYAPESAERVKAAQAALSDFATELETAARIAFVGTRERARVVAGNHIDFSLARVVKKRETGPLPNEGMWKGMF
jgi:tetratricopeptide (TPR) repeat protein